MRYKILCILLSCFIMMMTGCNSSDNNNDSQTTAQSLVSNPENLSDKIDSEFSARDMDVGYSSESSVNIDLSSFSGKSDSIEKSEDRITITKEGTYILTGALEGQIVINAGDSDKIQLVLSNAEIKCNDNSALYIKNADKVFITLAENSVNILSDGSEYKIYDEENNVDAVIFSKSDLTINGSGSLNINGNYKHGIVSKDDLIITGGNICVTTVSDGISGKDCVKIADGNIAINSGSDGIISSNTEDTAKGYIYISGGNFDIHSQTDGIQTETALVIDGGEFSIITAGGSESSTTQHSNDFPMSGRNRGDQQQTENSILQTEQSNESSMKAVKSGLSMTVNGGTFIIDSQDDSFHSNGDLSINGGIFTVNSGDDAFHADSGLTVSGGEIDVQSSYEGLEGNQIDITGGNIKIVSSDDGLNAAGGNDMSGFGGMDKSQTFNEESPYIKINDGHLYINAGCDGIDSNGALYISGGEVYVDGSVNGGNGALDFDRTGEITGGTVAAAGSSAMAQNFGTSSSQCSILYCFDNEIASNTEVILKDDSGKTLFSYTPSKTFSSIVISTPDIVIGKTYTIQAGDISSEISVDSVSVSNGKVNTFGGHGSGRPDGGIKPPDTQNGDFVPPNMQSGDRTPPDMSGSENASPFQGNEKNERPQKGIPQTESILTDIN